MQYILLTGIILSIFHSFVLFSKNDKTISDYILAFWFCFSGMPLFSYYLIYSQQYLTYPSFTVFGMTLPLASGPLLFLYTKYQTKPISFYKTDLLHFIPVIIISLLFIEFYFLPFETRCNLLKNGGIGYEMQGLIKLIAIYISGLVYIPLTLIILLKYKKNLNNQFSNTERINFNWLFYQVIGMAIVWIVILFIKDDRFIFGSVSIFIIWLSYFGSKQVNVFGTNTKIIKENSNIDVQKDDVNTNSVVLKYKKSTLNESSILKIFENLQSTMQSEKLYKNAELTLDDLAKALKVLPNHLSQVINSIENKNFYDYINQLRVDEFISLVSKSEHQKFTLLSIAFECGFNSKTSFNRNFKKIIGLTPSEYVKQENIRTLI